MLNVGLFFNLGMSGLFRRFYSIFDFFGGNSC